ncbi:MAG: hotdog domain-containing protein, partial [Halodesulfurarchaeum sp.]
DLNVSYLRPARGDLVGTAEVVRVGGSVGVSTISVESETPDGAIKEVAVGRGSFRIFRPEENETNP